MQGYRDPSQEQRASWRDHLNLARVFIPAANTALQQEWERLAAWAESLPTGPDHFGLIHYDFELDNLCWHEQDIGILDFDDASHNWYAADIAYALRDLFEGGVDFNDHRFREFVTGYAQQHPVDEHLLEQTPMFLRLHSMHVFGRLSRALDLPAGAAIPPWLQRLNEKLQGWVDRYRQST
jgi:Ser/Thr protein kinase RdoA (MazF antagonist)